MSEQQHCLHEHPCEWWGCYAEDIPCNREGCIDDTRRTPAPAADHRTYETCHKHFSCPDGEECWYLSEDYYWDCGNGASRVSEASQRASRKAREDVLGLARDMYSLMMCVEKTNTDEFMEYYAERMKGLKEQYESLRSTQQQAGEP